MKKALNEEYDLSYKAIPEYLTVDFQNSFEIMITNNSSSAIVFDNPSGLTPEEYPAYDDPAEKSVAAGFYLYFHYGDEGGDIVTKEDSVNYGVNVVNKTDWSVGYGDSPTVGRYWRVCPSKTLQLDAHDSLILRVDHIHTNQEAGATPLHIELRAEEEILPDTLDFMKLYKPAIRSFAPGKDDYDIGETVTFAWEVDNRDGCTLSISNAEGTMDVSVFDEYDLKMIDSSYTLIVKNAAGYAVQQQFVPAFTFITCFRAVDCDGDNVTLKWETRNGSACEIEGVGAVDLSGTKAVPAKRGSADFFSFKLRLTQKDSYKVHEQTITFGYAKITKLETQDLYYSTLLQRHPLELSEAVPFITPEEIQNYPTAPVITLPYDGGYDPPHPQWHHVVNFDGQYVDYYDLVGYGRYNGGAHCIERSENHYTLRAYSVGGRVYDERSI